MSSPFEIIRWDAPKPPDLELLQRMMKREGLDCTFQQMNGGERTPETRYGEGFISAVVSGMMQYAFPGYGVIEVRPGDWLEIQPGIIHDVLVLGEAPATFLQAFRKST